MVRAIVVLTIVLYALTAGAAEVVTDADARDLALARISMVTSRMQAYPGEPGGVAPWATGRAVPGEPVLVHSFADLAPSYYYVPVMDESGAQTSFVTLGASDGRVQAYGEVREGVQYPAVTREEAAVLGSSVLGIELTAEDLIAVSMPNRMLYWYLRPDLRGHPLFVNLGDPGEIHDRLDPSLVPPDVVAEPWPQTQTEEIVAPYRPEEGRYPSSYNLSVPHHYQGTSYHCGPASVEMVFDYWGPDIDQTDIGHVANCTPSAGSYASDNRRAGHFSCLSHAILDASLYGYAERWLGYGACENQWSNGGTSDPDYPTRYTDLYELIYAGYPVEVLTYYDASYNSGHFRVVKGYNNSTDVFIVHDPWYTSPYQGPNVNFDQTFFVDDLWTRYYRWGTLISPWKVDVSVPAGVLPGETFTLAIDVTYRGPHPFESQYSAGNVSANAVLPAGFELAPGETVDKSLPGLGSSGSTGSASWQVVAGCDPGVESIGAIATGEITGSSTSYASYGDVIGGEGATSIEVIAASRVIYVDVGGGGDFITIRDGIEDAHCDGDMVLVQPGYYVGSNNKDLDLGGKNIVVRGSGADNTFIDCQNSGRAFYFHSGEDTTARVSRFTIAGGHPSGTFPYGGGVEINGASPKLTDLVVTDCWAYCGGGISSTDGSPVLKNVAIINNEASDYGGGICCTRDSLGGRYEDVEIADNSAGYGGGGIYDTYNTHGLYDVYLHGNTAQWGGGMYIGRSAPTITRGHFQYNSATSGAAMYIPYESEAEITRTTIVHNTTQEAAYAAIQSDDSQPTITRTIIAFNYGGGAVGCSGPKLPTFYHDLSYGNAGGDSLCGDHHDNLFVSPYFCDEQMDDFTLHVDSPCLPAYNPWSVHIGRYGDGACGYSGVDDALPEVTRLSLGSPAPNPFGSSVHVGYEAPGGELPLRVAVYSLSGRLVKVLHSGAPESPVGTLAWDGTDETGARVAAGVYFVRASHGSETAARKLVVLR